MLDPFWKLCKTAAEEFFQKGNRIEAFEMVNVAIECNPDNIGYDITSLFLLLQKILISFLDK